MSGDTQNTDSNAQNNANSGGQNAGGQAATVTMTQAEFDTIIGNRATRAGEAAVNKVLESIGLKSTDELTAALKEWRDGKQAQLTELDKLKATSTDLQSKLEAANAAKAEAEARHLLALKQFEVQKIAAELRFIVPDEVWLYVVSDGHAEKITVDPETGKVSGVREVIKAIAEKRKHLVEQEKAGPRLGTPRPGGQTGQQSQGAGGQNGQNTQTPAPRVSL